MQVGTVQRVNKSAVDGEKRMVVVIFLQFVVRGFAFREIESSFYIVEAILSDDLCVCRNESELGDSNCRRMCIARDPS